MAVDRALADRVLAAVPQQRPFRFIDEILDLSAEGITATYTFRPDEDFYAGHFPGNPVTPGVILIETMAQTGVVAFGLSLLMSTGMSDAEIRKVLTLFSYVETVEFLGMVKPGEKVFVTGEKLLWRKNMLKVRVTMTRESGEAVCTGVIAGMAVKSE